MSNKRTAAAAALPSDGRMAAQQTRSTERLHPHIEAALQRLTVPAAVELADAVCSKTALGMPCRAGSVAAQAADAKRRAPDAVVLLRVGDCFYEAFGADAVLLVEHCGVQAARGGKELRACVRHDRVQAALTALLTAGHRAAIYEESRVLVTPRQRVFAQLVCAAQPTYAHAADADAAAPPARPIVAVAAAAGDAWDVAVCDLQLRQVRLFAQVERSTAEALVARAALPVVCVRAVPIFVRAAAPGAGDVVVLGGMAEASVDARLLAHVAAAHYIEAAEFARVPACVGACAPLPRFTLQHLGIDDPTGATPSLVDACLTPRAAAPLRHQLQAWLTQPPTFRHALSQAVEALGTWPRPLPELRAGRAGRWRAGLVGYRVDALTSLRVNVDALATLAETGECAAPPSIVGLAVALAEDARLSWEGLRFCALRAALHHAVTRDGVRTELYATEESALRAAEEARAALLAAHPDGSWSTLAGATCFFGGIEAAQDRLPCRDKSGRVLPERHCTAASLDADGAVAAAIDARDAARDAAVRAACEGLRAYEAEMHVVESWATALLTLVDHVRAVGGRWTAAGGSADATLRCTGLQPYWLSAGVRNDVNLRPGVPVVLTAPNGGGKSTLLRSLAATALLAQVGLLVPCARAYVPDYAHLFLRSGAVDCAAERKSSFGAEVCDLTTMLTAEGGTLVLVDEPCRGTPTADGVGLLEAILEHVPAQATCVATTHFHELRAPTCEWMQLTARVDERTAECTPEYALVPGRCERSLALQVALHAGLPIGIVRAARRPDDEDTAVLTVLHGLDLRYTRMRATEIAPASLRTALYVLLTTRGVYVGETDAIADRLKAHVRDKSFDGLFLVALDHKTDARNAEALIIQELLYCNVRVLSVVDGNHAVR